jgi:hypothetical protein
MTKEAFEAQVRYITEAFGDRAVRFFTAIGNMTEFFQQADQALEASPITFREFERTAERIVTLVGMDEAAQLFQAIFDAVPKKTVRYLGLLVKVFERREGTTADE